MPGDKIEISGIDEKKYKENFDQIDWGDLKDKPVEKIKNKKHVTAGMCGEFGMSVFDEKAFKENFDRIDWSKKKD
jgi:hypothetical protein